MANRPGQPAGVLREALEAVGATVVFLPSAAPDLAPLALCWSKLKQRRRAAQAQTRAAWDQALTRRSKECLAADAALGWFAHWGLGL